MNNEMQHLEEFRHMVAQTRHRPNGRRVQRLLREPPELGQPAVRRPLVWVVTALIAAGLLLLAGRPATAAVPPTPYEAGVQAAAEHRYAEALSLFQHAAEQGERDAMRNLGLMLLYGELLYGQQVARQPGQARRWLQAAAAQGCEVSVFMSRRLARRA